MADSVKKTVQEVDIETRARNTTENWPGTNKKVVVVTRDMTVGAVLNQYLAARMLGSEEEQLKEIKKSLGYILDLLPERIKTGVDINNPQQVQKALQDYKDKTIKELEEEVKVEEKITEDETIQSKPLDLESLVDEYEAYLAENSGDVRKATAMMSNRHGHLIDQWVKDLQAFYGKDVKDLEAKGWSKQDSMKTAEVIAAEQVRIISEAQDEKAKGIAQEAARIMGEQVTKQLNVEKDIAIKEAVKEANEKAHQALKKLADKAELEGKARTEYLGKVEAILTSTTEELLVDEKVTKIVDNLINKLPESNKREDNTGLTKIEATQIEDAKNKETLKIVTKEAFKQAIVEGDLSPGMIVSEVKKKSGVDLSGFGDEIKQSLTKIDTLVKESPEAVATYVDQGVKNELIASVLTENPKLSVAEAVAFGDTVAKVFSAKRNPLNNFEIDNAVEQAKSAARTAKDNSGRSEEEYKEVFWKMSAMTRMTSMSTEEYQKLKENFGKIDLKLQGSEGLSSRVRALQNSMDLFEKLDPRLNSLLKKLHLNNHGQSIPGVLSISGIKQLEGGVNGLKKIGWLQKVFGTVNSPLGQAVFSVAANGFTVDTVGAFVMGFIGKEGLGGALKLAGGKLATSATGKVLVKGGTALLGKLGIAVGLQAAPVVGQIITVLMFIPDLINLIKKPLNKITKFLDSIGLNILGDIKKSLGVKSVPALLMGGALALGTAIISIPALFATMSFLPLAPILIGTIGGIQGYSLMQTSRLVGQFTPGRPIGSGGGEDQTGTEGVGIGVTYFNGPIPEGCPSGWPIIGSGWVYAGPNSIRTHQGSSAQSIDVDAAAMTPIIATHPGTAFCETDRTSANGGYGKYVKVLSGKCPVTIKGVKTVIPFVTMYGHMAAWGSKCGLEVKQGDVIGFMDSTGNSTGNHVHYEIMGGVLGDINQYLPKFVQPGCDGNCGVVLP